MNHKEFNIELFKVFKNGHDRYEGEIILNQIKYEKFIVTDVDTGLVTNYYRKLISDYDFEFCFESDYEFYFESDIKELIINKRFSKICHV